MPDRQVHQVAVLPGWVTTAANRNGWLEDWRLAAGLLTVAVLLLAGWVVVAVRGHRAGRRPRHPVARRLGLGTLVALVTLAGVGAAANSYAGYVPDVASLSRQVPSLVGARNAGGATVDTTTLAAGSRYGPKLISVTLPDRADRIPAGRTWVYLPEGYSDPANADRRYPVVYLIHGWISSSYDWFGGGEAAKIAAFMQRNGLIQPMILVAPDASAGTNRDTECLNSTTGGPRIETFLTRTVVTAIDSRFRTLPARADRAIGGLSAGGYCALNIGLHHQDEYAAIMAMEPFGDPGPSAIKYMLGGNQTLGRANSPTDYVRTLPIHRPQNVFFGAARNDETKDTAQSIAGILAGRGETVSLSMATSYGHTWREGRAELPYALDFASKVLASPPRTVTSVGRPRQRRTPVPARSFDPPRRSGSGRHGGS